MDNSKHLGKKYRPDLPSGNILGWVTCAVLRQFSLLKSGSQNVVMNTFLTDGTEKLKSEQASAHYGVRKMLLITLQMYSLFSIELMLFHRSKTGSPGFICVME